MTNSHDPFKTSPRAGFDPYEAPEPPAPPDPFTPRIIEGPGAFSAPADPPFGGPITDPVAAPVGAHNDLFVEPRPMPQEPVAAVAVERVGDASSLGSRIVDEFVAWLKTLASAAVYATLIVTFGFQVARVEGQSMAPTLEDQDRLIVNKLAYRLGEPRIGDIVMLHYPNNPSKSFVKRVIGAEGNTVRIVDGKVYSNDVLMDDTFVPAEFRSHDDWGPQVIPEGYYFVMGDHRNNSSDSRHWGFVPKKYIIGRVQLRWWPVPAARTF